MTAWFRWERTNGRWNPVVIYGDKPKAPRGEDERCTTPQIVPVDCLGPDVSPMFGRLQETFPAPVEKAD